MLTSRMLLLVHSIQLKAKDLAKLLSWMNHSSGRILRLKFLEQNLTPQVSTTNRWRNYFRIEGLPEINTYSSPSNLKYYF